MNLQEKIQNIRKNSFYRFKYDPTMLVSRTVKKIMSVLKLSYKALTEKGLTDAQKEEVLEVMVLLIAEFEVVKEKSQSKYVHLKSETNK